jgi:UDP-glucose 4-epimerase
MKIMNIEEIGKILVTGGAGFIGSHLVNYLSEKKCDITIIDNLSAGNYENIANVIKNDKINFIENDLSNYKNNELHLDEISTVFHLAAYPEVRTGHSNPELAYKENIENTYVLLEKIRKSNVKKIIFASSSVVYGEPEFIPTPENYGPLLPISPYGGSKLACEGLISAYCNNYGIQGIILRLANVIGSRSRHGVIWDFLNKLRNDKNKLEILGDGKQTKSYVHVKDCIDAFVFSLLNSEKKMNVMNIGNNDQIEVKDIAKIVCDNSNLPNTKLVFSGGTKDGRGWIGDVKEMRLDITKLKQMGWMPKFSSAEAVDLATKELLKEMK